MIVSVTRKLQAFSHLPGYEGLRFMAYRALLTPDQVRAYGLPSSPLNAGRSVEPPGRRLTASSRPRSIP